MKTVNCTLEVPKKFMEVASQVVYHENTKSYEIFANEGFMLENEYKIVEVYSKKRALEVIRNAVKIEFTEVVQTSLDLDTEVVEVVEVAEVVAEEKVAEVAETIVVAEVSDAKKALISDYKNRIKSDFDSKLFSVFKSVAYRKYAPLIEFSLPYGKVGKLYRNFKSDGKNFFMKSKGEFHTVTNDDTISVFIDGNLYNKVNALEVLKVAYSYHKKRSFLNVLRKTNTQGLNAIEKQNAIEEQNRINELISKQFDNVLKSKIVHEFLVLGNSVEKIEKTYPKASLVLQSLNLTEVNKGNFSNVSNGNILSTLKRHKRLDLVKLFEIFFYGINNNIQRFRNIDGIPC